MAPELPGGRRSLPESNVNRRRIEPEPKEKAGEGRERRKSKEMKEPRPRSGMALRGGIALIRSGKPYIAGLDTG